MGQDAYFVGFPFGLDHAKTYSSLPNVFGLVKKATVAQLDSMPDRKMARILLDGYNNPGFSGSPLVFRDLHQSGLTFKVAGVIVSYEASRSPVMKKIKIQENQITPADRAQNRILRADGQIYRLIDTDKVVELNTGIATAWDIGSAVDLIRNHPIVGPQVIGSFTGEDVGTQSHTPQQ